MLKYLTIFRDFFNNNLIREMEFRSNFIILAIIDSFWVFWQLIMVELMFQFTDSILGWQKYEIFLLIGYARFIKGLYDCFTRVNILRFPETIIRGDLDFVLTKPINSIFLVSFRYHKFSDLGNAIGGLIVIIYAVIKLNISLNFYNITLFLLLGIISLVALYCLILIFTTFAIFVPRLSALKPYYDVINHLARQPGEIFSQGKFINELILLPILIIGTIPIKLLLDKLPVYFFVFEILVTGLLFFVTIKFWHFALKHYSSASS